MNDAEMSQWSSEYYGNLAAETSPTFEIVMTADMLETGMVIRTSTGTEYPIEVTREGDDIIVDADGFRITYSKAARENGCGFLSSSEREWDWYNEEALLAYQEADAAAEAEMEARMERYWEEGTESQHMQYLHEVEMDERRASFPF